MYYAVRHLSVYVCVSITKYKQNEAAKKECFTISTYWAEKCHGSPANIEQALCFYRCARIYLYAFLWMQRPLIATHWISVHYARGKAILMSLLKSFAWSTHSEYFTLVCVCAFFFPFSKSIGISNSELVFAICYLKCSVKIALVQL